MEHWWNDTDRGNQSNGRKACPIATSSTTNLTASNPSLRDERQAADSLSHGMATYGEESVCNVAAVSCFEIQALFYQTTRSHIPEVCTPRGVAISLVTVLQGLYLSLEIFESLGVQCWILDWKAREMRHHGTFIVLGPFTFGVEIFCCYGA
jgi:hypothetical protein